MDHAGRKKSPRAPSIPLDEAIERATRIYEKERRHPVPVDVVAQDMGYKNSKNGAALSAIASLRYYGLLDRPEEGKLSVSKDVETYKFAPQEQTRREMLIRWLGTPTVFSELLEKFKEGLPSDATLKFELIQRGFSPTTADACLAVFRRSVDFARFFEVNSTMSVPVDDNPEGNLEGYEVPSGVGNSTQNPSSSGSNGAVAAGYDRIPVRLSRGRKAWLEIPTPFYSADKERLKAQIEFLLTDDDDEALDGL